MQQTYKIRMDWRSNIPVWPFQTSLISHQIPDEDIERVVGRPVVEFLLYNFRTPCYCGRSWLHYPAVSYKAGEERIDEDALRIKYSFLPLQRLGTDSSY